MTGRLDVEHLKAKRGSWRLFVKRLRHPTYAITDFSIQCQLDRSTPKAKGPEAQMLLPAPRHRDGCAAIVKTTQTTLNLSGDGLTPTVENAPDKQVILGV
jgi:hypothetical protein